MKKKVLNVLIVLFAIIFIVAGVKFIKEYTQMNKEDKEFQDMKKAVQEDEGYPFDKNSDMFAWVRVDGTYIDYPVMLTPDEPEFYLHMDFNKNYSYSGTPFLDYRCDGDSDNMVIFGHNMKNETMFSTLSYYEDESFFKEHGYVDLILKHEKRKYKVIAALKTDVDKAEYIYDFIYAAEDKDMDWFVDKVKSQALYDTGVDAGNGDKLLTLSTCAYHTENGRFILIAKRVK